MNIIQNKTYNFLGWGRIICFCSIFLCIISCNIMIMRGFNWGLDFVGGIFIEINSEQDLDIVNIRDFFAKENFKNSVITYLNNSKNVIIKLPLSQQNNIVDHQIKIKILNILNDNIPYKFTIQQMNWVGPSSNKNLIKQDVIALFAVLVCIVMYLTFRFEFRLAIGTVISLIHDIIIIFGVLSAFSIEINAIVIVALISAIGYSLNDNIVIFDRIRENYNSLSNLSSFEIFNISLSQVFNRTIITSMTTVAVLLILLFFGGAMLYEFSIILLVGVIIGTMSSVYIASVLVFYLKTNHKHSV